MTITVEIPDDIERQIRENAARGDTDAVHQLLLEALTPTVEALITGKKTPSTLSNEEFERLANQLVDTFMEYVDPDCPPLSDYAVRREGIYEGHPKL